jgi:subtilisin-like proprotein convertase family protein/Tfp pilus assembly protein PilN
MTSDGSPEHRRPSLIDINLASVERQRREGPSPISPFSVIVVFLILILAYAIFPFAALTEDSDIPNLYGVWHEQQDDIDSLKDTLTEKEELRDWLIALAGEAGDLSELINETESLLGAMEQDYTALSQGTVTWSEVLEAIEDAAPVGVTLTSIEEGSSIDIEGTAATDALISEYAAALEDTGLFSDVDITEHELDENTSASSEISIETCETVWNPSDTVVFAWADSKDYMEGLYSAKQSISTSFSSGLVAYQNEAKDLRDGKYIVFWIKSNADLPAGVFQFVFYSPSFEPYSPITFFKEYINNADVPIPDYDPLGSSVHSDITVPTVDDLAITSVELDVKIVHPAETDLVVKVKHPDGTEYVLHNQTGAGADIDETYKISTTFANKHSQGTWQLLARDMVTGNTGYIDTWTLKITGTIPLTPAPTPTPTPTVTPTPTPTPTAWPTIDYRPSNLCFSSRQGTNPSDQTLEIWNSSGGILYWSVTSNVSWLSLTPTSGTSTGEVDYVTVSVDAASKRYTNNTDVNIPDNNGWVNSDIIIPAPIPPAVDLTITSVDVYVKITHPSRGELEISVRHPDLTEEVVHVVDLTDADANIDQWYNIPVKFDGKQSQGTWQLRVRDTAAGNTGVIDSWTLKITGTPPPLDTGSHTATITIKDTTALNSPQTVPVYLTIREPVMVERLGIPGLNADSWTEVILPLSDASKICSDYSVALYATHDPGACTLWLDDIRATLEPTPGPYEFTITVTLAGGGS